MLLARVLGAVVVEHGHPGLRGLRLLLLRATDVAGRDLGETLVAADLVGASDDDRVLVTRGRACAEIPELRGRPVDAAIVGLAPGEEAT